MKQNYISFSMHGSHLQSNMLIMTKSRFQTTSDRFTKVCVKNELAHEDCDPKVNLTHRVIPLMYVKDSVQVIFI